MRKKTVFIAHPITGDVPGNMRKVLEICEQVHRDNVIPVAPYLVSLQYLNDDITEDRNLGIEANLESFHRSYVDELWLFGDRISKGMEEEILLSKKEGIPVIPKTEGTSRDFVRFA